jgi:hypothetical protein
VTKAWFLTDRAEAAVAEIYDYTYLAWGEDQAEKYIQGIFDRFEAISLHLIFWRPIKLEYGVSGFLHAMGSTSSFGASLARGKSVSLIFAMIR